MGALFWIVAAGAAAGGYYFYRRLTEMEEEIRREIGEPEEASPGESPTVETERSPAEATPARETRSGREAEADPGSMPSRVLAAVQDVPGVLQTELYGEFPEAGKRTLQEKIRALEEEGHLRREKEGSSYRLFPADPPT